MRRWRLCAVRAARSPTSPGLGVSQPTLRHRVKQVALDAGERDDGLTTVEREELKQLRRRVRRLEQEREILKQATAFLASETR